MMTIGSEQMEQQHIDRDRKYSVMELFGKKVLYVPYERLSYAEIMNAGLYKYEIGKDGDGFKHTLSDYISLNFEGTVISANLIKLGADGLFKVDVTDERYLLGYDMTFDEYRALCEQEKSNYYMLITVIGREIITESFKTHKKAFETMKLEWSNAIYPFNDDGSMFDVSVIQQDEFEDDKDDCGFNRWSAYVTENRTGRYDCDWRIVPIRSPIFCS